MAVFPEDMNRIDPSAPQEALRVIEQYISYMKERVEFSFSQMTKNVTAAGVSNVEIYIQLTALQHSMSAMTSDINNLIGRMNSAEGDISGIEGDISSIEGDITSIQNYITNTIDVQLQSLDQRVTALEGRL